MDRDIAGEFLVWVRETYIPAALASGHCSSPALTRILTEIEPGTTSFALHLHAADLDSAARWHDSDGAVLRDRLQQRFGQRIVFFSTYMEEVE